MNRPARPPTQKPEGFTLLEVMIAVSLFAVLAAVAYLGLNSIVRAQQSLQAQSGRLAVLEQVLQRLQLDTLQAVPRAVRAAYGAEPSLIGDATELRFTTQTLISTEAGPLPQLRRVSYRLQGEKLFRSEFSGTDLAPNTPERKQLLLDNVQQFQLRYFDQTLRATTQWPSANTSQGDSSDGSNAANADVLPRALEISFRTDKLATVRRVYLLSESAPAQEQAP